MKQNLRRAVNLTALVLAAGLLIGLFTGCQQNRPPAVGPNGSNESSQPNGPVQPTDPSIFRTDGNGVITGYTCDKEDLPKALVIPAKIGNEVITGIRDNAFYGCKGLTSLDLSGCTSLTVIGVEAVLYSRMGTFEGCTGLTEVKLPASLTEIGERAFEGCTGLTNIDLSACTSLTEISGFSGCTGLTSIDLSACTSLTEIGISAFEGCKGLTEVKLPANLTEIGKLAFTNCSKLTGTIVFPANLKTIKSYTNSTYPYSIVGAFEGCTKLQGADFSACTNFTKIESSTFKNCKGLTEVKLPASLTEIGKRAFEGCTGLTSIDLSGCTSLTEIGERAFTNCFKLTGTIVFPASLKTIKTYRESSYPYDFVGAFQYCTKLQGADFSACANFTKIENSTFKNCEGLTEVKLPASLTEIREEAFKDCVNLTSAVFADKNRWEAGSTTIDPSDLDNAAIAAKYLREETDKGGYCDKWWKKN